MKAAHLPLAARMRPKDLNHFFGQSHLLAKHKPLWQAIAEGQLHSMVFWGPPGTGKTTLARMLAQQANARWESLSAVTAGVKDIREVMARAEKSEQETILFVDEVHRFNKAQQDAFLPYVENGTVTFVGATTENPSFELNNALLSRLRVYVLKRLTQEELIAVLEQALADPDCGVGDKTYHFPTDGLKKIAIAADGDARMALNLLEIATDLAEKHKDKWEISEKLLDEVLSGGVRRFDKGGDIFYDEISALHKSVRGSDPDAALYWLCRMLDGGCDPLYLARRIVRMANEDIGNADPRALTLALNAWDVMERLGSPEGELALAQTVIYLSVAAKSNASYVAFNAAMQAAKQYGSLEVPVHLRNAPTRLMKELGYGRDYRYAHKEPNAYVPGERYFPLDMPVEQYYFPVPRGLEIKIAEKLASLRAQSPHNPKDDVEL